MPVFPCEAGGKRPLTRNGHWDATTDERRVRAWWGKRPSANVGVPTGEKSGLLVLDVDPAGGGEASLASLERSRGSAPPTARARTGGGGLHLYFRYPARGPGTGRGPPVRNSAGYLGPGLDVRGEGGYVVVPPSRTADRYRWIDRSRPSGAAWLLGCLEERTRRDIGETLF